MNRKVKKRGRRTARKKNPKSSPTEGYEKSSLRFLARTTAPKKNSRVELNPVTCLRVKKNPLVGKKTLSREKLREVEGRRQI
jgi:hypothetical protein